jgi:ATP-dependent DNA helicase RecQ
MHEKTHKQNADKISSIAFVDLEIDSDGQNVLDYGAVRYDDSSFHGASRAQFFEFIAGAEFICGHNIFAHAVKYLDKEFADHGLAETGIIDTLLFSPLLFPRKPYHHLVKDDKLSLMN